MATVLVCDDSALVRETLHRSVASVPGITRIVDAVSGEEALARWPVERPSLVLMDVRMPGIGGVEATQPGPPSTIRGDGRCRRRWSTAEASAPGICA